MMRMNNKKWVLVTGLVVLLTGCEDLLNENSAKGMVVDQTVYENGYDIPIEDSIREESEKSCMEMLGVIQDIYKAADKGNANNQTLPEEIVYQMLEEIENTGSLAMISEMNEGIHNYEEVEEFLEYTKEGMPRELVLYDVLPTGGIKREKFIFDGEALYLLESLGAWNEDVEPITTSTVYTRIKEWEYTEKGWLSFEYCTPEYPEVTERIDGEVLIRVKPVDKEYFNIAKKYLLPLSYIGNNLLSSNWDAEHMEAIDYNGLYEYLYTIEYEKEFNLDMYIEGIPKEEFERVITKYLPVTREQVRQYALFDEEKEVYYWTRVGCGNYKLNSFWTSFPEITDIRENQDGTVTLCVDAVCEMEGDDCAMSHELTVRFTEEGICYLGNQILKNGLERIPEYQYRIPRE